MELAAGFVEAALAFTGEAVDAAARTAAARGVGGFPGAFNEAVGFQLVEGGVEGALHELERARAGVFKAFEELEAVGITAAEGGEDEGLEVAAEKVAVDGGHGLVYSL